MPGVPISGLPAVGTPALTDIMPEVQPAVGGTTYKCTFQQLLTLFSGSINVTFTAIGSTPNAQGASVTGTAITLQPANASFGGLLTNGAQTIGGAKTLNTALNLGGNPINSVADPTLAQDAATKNYVDQTALNGTAVYAASAATLGTVTQSGAGVGATLTNAGTQATFALDGVNPPVGSSVLIKNTATGMTAANEGIYVVTNAGSGATNWILTRSTDYDTPAQINGTGLIVVQNGSTLVGTAWYNTSTIVTVDVTSFNYSRFGNTNAINKIAIQTFIAGTSTYTPTTGMVECTVEIVGGGGGGGGAAGGGGSSGQGGGGGGGGYCRKTYTASLLGTTATVVVGASASGGASGNHAGTGGNQSTFTPSGAGAILTGGPGSGGNGMAATTTVNSVSGGGAGAASGGDLNIPGGTGEGGIVILGSAGVNAGGGGGASYFSPFGANTLAGGANNGINYGGGGQGGAANGGANVVGGNSAPGYCYITEYCSV